MTLSSPKVSKPLAPNYGRRLLPQVVDDKARQNPLTIFASIPKSVDIAEGFKDVSFGEVATAVNFMAYQLRKVFGSELEYESETLTYVGLPDLRYNIVFYAAVKCGYKVLFISPRNPPSTNLSLMEQTQSSKIVYSPELKRLVDGLVTEKQNLNCLMIESLDTILASEAEHFPFDVTFDQAQRKPIVIIHSSGSTGIPKPIQMTHGTFATMDTDRFLPTVPGRRNLDFTVWDYGGVGGRVYEPFPPFYLAGFYNKLVIPVFANAVPVFGPSTRPPSGSLVAEIMEQTRLDGILLPPTIIEELLHKPNGLDYFKRLGRVAYAGGPLSPHVGDAITKVTTLVQQYGSTEVGMVRQLIPQKEDWSYMEFHPLLKHEFQIAEDDAFELVLFADETTEKTSSINHNFPGLTEWRTKDLFKPHPTKPNLWRFHGRRDDIIVFSSGQKFNPVPTESRLQGHPMISGALVTGQGRFQAALLIEPKLHDEDVSSFINSVWPAIEEANLQSPSQGFIAKSMILVTSQNKPFVRAGKGTVVRKLTEASYAHEIAALYDNSITRTATAPLIVRVSNVDPEMIHEFIRSVVTPSLPEPLISDEENFYNLGMDSLRTIEAVDKLRVSISSYRQLSELSWITPEVFYNFPSIKQLSGVVLAFLNEGTVPGKKDRVAEMASLFQRLTKDLSPPSLSPPIRPTDGITVALTGSTGAFGTQMLQELLQSHKIKKIYCLNRSGTAKQHWERAVASRALTFREDSPPTVFLTTDLTKSNFGLQDHEYKNLQDECDIVLHSAWKVDFNQSLPSFTANLQSIRSLIDFSLSSPQIPRVVFISSISSVGPWGPYHKQGSTIPEAAISDFAAALEMGYAESKAIAEQVLEAAASQSHVPVSILRVGQIAGSTKLEDPAWSEKELIPGFMKTSKALGSIPESGMEDVDWIPSDKVSKIVLELLLHDMTKTPEIVGTKYYNLVNPYPTPWKDLLAAIQEFCGPDAQLVSLSEWVKKLKELDVSDREELEAKPALKTLKFFERMADKGPSAVYETNAAMAASESLRELRPIDQDMMRRWLG